MEEDFLLRLLDQKQLILKKLISCNAYTEKFGIRLSEGDALLLAEERTRKLREEERVEFGEGILPKLIFAFCDSPYIYQDNYVETIATLQDIFYLYKNESLDELSDDELIARMKESFEGECEGSLEHLEDTTLEAFAREIRERTHGFFGTYGGENE